MSAESPEVADLKARVRELERMVVDIGATLGAVLETFGGGREPFNLHVVRQRFASETGEAIVRLTQGKRGDA